jgi:uncharacterized protein (DUF1330 family)
MSAYIIVEIEVKDEERYAEYRRQVPPLVAKYGGKYLARGGRMATLEGGPPAKRVVVLEFPTYERAMEWWTAEDYKALKEIRLATTESRMILIEGIAEQPS